MNKDAGRDSWLIVTLHLDDGKELPFVVDTGSAKTIFDESLASKLGKCRGTDTAWNFGVNHDLKVFAAPRMYLGNVQLLTDSNVYTVNLRKLSGKAHRIDGVLGMDVLRHYCVQLDFTKNKMCFLDDRLADKETWGQAISLANVGDGCFYIHANLTGAKGAGSLIDSGCNGDGWLTPELYQQWTNQTAFASNDRAHSPNGVLDGQNYHDLDLNEQAPSTNDSHITINGIGIHVLSQNLVTFDFPERTLYLKRATTYPLSNKRTKALMLSDAKSAFKFLRRLKNHGGLPGWLKTDQGAGDVNGDVHYNAKLETVTLIISKMNSPFVYHFTVVRKAKGPWKLQRAWRTDKNETVLEEYPLAAR